MLMNRLAKWFKSPSKKVAPTRSNSSRSRQLRLEHLEERWCPTTTYTWNGSGTYWNLTSNWNSSGGTYPHSGDTAIFDGNVSSVGSTLNSGVLMGSLGQLTFKNSYTGTLTLNTGLTTNGSSVESGSNMTVTGNTLTLAGTTNTWDDGKIYSNLVVNGTAELMNGFRQIGQNGSYGTTVTVNGGKTLIVESSAMTVYGTTITVNGTMDMKYGTDNPLMIGDSAGSSLCEIVVAGTLKVENCSAGLSALPIHVSGGTVWLDTTVGNPTLTVAGYCSDTSLYTILMDGTSPVIQLGTDGFNHAASLSVTDGILMNTGILKVRGNSGSVGNITGSLDEQGGVIDLTGNNNVYVYTLNVTGDMNINSTVNFAIHKSVTGTITESLLHVTGTIFFDTSSSADCRATIETGGSAWSTGQGGTFLMDDTTYTGGGWYNVSVPANWQYGGDFYDFWMTHN